MSGMGDFEFEDFKRFSKQWQKAIDAGIAQEVIDLSLKQAGQVILAGVKERTPVGETGFLRGDWRLTKSGNSIEISNNMHYAPFVEYGHRLRNGGFLPGVFMLRDAINDFHDKFEYLVERNLKKKLKEYGLL
ncbi:HK97 gp10 family phage protein [Leuconostocaceae bacterium ESL0958]|nr:HK97 gp10 family phage protein [Leuconostocaceae bacterium ESL0958]